MRVMPLHALAEDTLHKRLSPTTPLHRRVTMLLIREVFHCRPGKVRPLLEKFQAMNRIMAKASQGNMREPATKG